MQEVFAELERMHSPISFKTILPNKSPSCESVEKLFADALVHPIDVESFYCEKPEKAAIVFSDATRFHSPFIGQLVRMIEKKTDDIKIISAHGTHAPSPSGFFERALGEELCASYKNNLVISTTQNPSSEYQYIGETDRGTPVELHKDLLDRDLIVSSFNVQPHYFAGYEGGAKSILPGCSSLRTIIANHSLVIGNPTARELRIDGNDLREDVNQSFSLLSKFGVKHRIMDFVLNRERNVVRVSYGNPVSAHKLIAETCAKQIYCVKAQPAHTIVTIAEGPSGNNLYQALKAVAFASNMTINKPGKKSLIILFAALEEGIGGQALRSEIEKYKDKEASEILNDLKQRGKEGKITEASQKLNRLAIDDSRMDLIIVSPKAPRDVEELLCKTKYRFSRRLDEAFDSLNVHAKRDVAVLPYGSSTVPFIW